MRNMTYRKLRNLIDYGDNIYDVHIGDKIYRGCSLEGVWNLYTIHNDLIKDKPGYNLVIYQSILWKSDIRFSLEYYG